MTITQTAPLTADTFADLWSQMLRWESAEATAEAGDEHPLPEDDPYWDEDDEPSYDAEWDADDYGILRYRVTRSY